MPTDRCLLCSDALPTERIEYGYVFCRPCVDEHPTLMATTAVIIHTSHKQGPMVVRPDQYSDTSAYNR